MGFDDANANGRRKPLNIPLYPAAHRVPRLGAVLFWVLMVVSLAGVLGYFRVFAD